MRTPWRRRVSTIPLILACLLVAASAAQAGPLDITRFHARQGPRNLTVGPDGNLYYSSSGGDVGRVTLDGQATMINVPNDSTTEAIAAGPDGNIWYIPQYSNYVGKITPAGVVTTYPLAGSTHPNDITAGPDGAMWFTQPYPDTRPTIGRITTDGVITKFRIPTPESRPTSITAGPDGNLWFTEPDAGKVGRITPQGVVTEFSGRDAVSPDHITPGRDGRLWFADIYYGDVYTITTDGQVAPNPIPVPSSFDKGIEALVATPADTMWLAGRWEYLASVDRSHEVTEYPVRDQSIGDLVLAPGGDLWFSNGSEVARIDRDWNAVLSLDTGFLPRVMSVGLGERVRWQATGARPVQIQADGGGFDSGALVIGERYLRRFASAGSFPYHDPADGRDGVVRVPMSATASGSPTMIALQWSVLPPTGDRFDVQVLVPGATAWTSLRSVTADVAGSFEPASGPGVYRFRARTRSDASVSGWSRGTTVTV